MAIIGALPVNIINGDPVDAPTAMSLWDYIRNQVNANAAASGINNDITALTALSTPLTPTQGGTPSYYSTSDSAGTGTALTLANLVPNNFTLTAGRRVAFRVGVANTGDATLDVMGLGAKQILKVVATSAVALTAGDFSAGMQIELYYNGANWLWLSPAVQGFGILTALTTAATVDLSQASSHNVFLSGNAAPITSFGTNATTYAPVYRLVFDNNITLVHGVGSGTINCPNSQSILTQAGDAAVVSRDVSGQWRVVSYARYNGRALIVDPQYPSLGGNARKWLTTDGSSMFWNGNGLTAACTFAGNGVLEGGSFNVSGVSRTGTGVYVVSFANALNNVQYQVQATPEDGAIVASIRSHTRTTSNVTVVVNLSGNGVGVDPAAVHVNIFGGL